ncbi:S-locus glycoprotein [Corchorus olitorius]|uniref:S-locus glycoprotein n=1 Tax=Corchorus olitorius TaxID=93759 RepID=A0A1R3GS67_9ROSI|nr:S-locus glycoprotein [Corchorus olitorius]
MVIMNGTRWILTAFLTLIIIQSLLLNLIIAQNLDYPSVVYPPLSWRNGLSSKSNFGSLEAAGVKPILVNGNFVCGFHCTSTTLETCFFAISFFNTSFAAVTGDNSNPSPEIVIVWSANRNNPVQLEAELKFTQQGDLVLQDAHGALVWSTNTTAARLNLTHQGNLLLFDKTNKVLWQSFDHPTDSFLPGQRLVYGQKLRSSQSEMNLSEGLYSFIIDDHGYFMAYMEPDPFQVYYWSDRVYSSRTKAGQFYTEFEDMATLWNSTFTLIKIRSDGHLMGYQSTNSSWTESMDIFGINQCNYPLVCGEYGLCTESSDSTTCSCPGVGVKKYSKKVDEEDYLDHIISGLPTRFSYEELKVITKNFSIKLGEGGFGRKAKEEQLEDLVDKHGDEMQSNASEVVKTMKVAACCLRNEIRRRPSMSTVVKVLEGSMNIEDSLSYDFSNLPELEAVATDSLILASSLSGPR